MEWFDDRMGRVHDPFARAQIRLHEGTDTDGAVRPRTRRAVRTLLLTGLLSAVVGCGVVLLAEGLR